jgi:short-subunit dehydrogenase
VDLTNSTCLVTGANRGIGRAIAAELARRPVRRVLAGVRDLDAYEPIGGPVEPVQLDLSSRSRIERGWAAIDHDVDVLVNNAGLFEGGRLGQQDAAAIDAMVQVNLAGLMQLSRLAVQPMLERGRGAIVNNASISGYVFLPGATTYAATKAGVVAFSEALRRELRGSGVEVLHLVTPGVETDMLAATRDAYDGHSPVELRSQLTPAEWAARVVRGLESGDHIVGPGGALALGKLASRGPAALLDLVSSRFWRG